MSRSPLPGLWIAGPSGAGKTAVAWTIYKSLIGRGAHAGYLDVDQVGICYPEPGRCAPRTDGRHTRPPRP